MRINYIDNGDSFAHTIKAYFEMCGADVKMYRSNCSLETAISGNPDMILLGPGPNGPREAGNYMELLDKYHKEIPFFGICLGFQAIMEYFGQPVVPLDDIVHGDRVLVIHDERSIFKGIEPIRMIGGHRFNFRSHFARYNSLGVYEVPECFEETARSDGIIMAAEHRELPIQGVQFHPESVLSMKYDNGMELIRNVVRLYSELKK